MKKLFTLLSLVISSTCYSQTFGDNINEVALALDAENTAYIPTVTDGDTIELFTKVSYGALAYGFNEHGICDKINYAIYGDDLDVGYIVQHAYFDLPEYPNKAGYRLRNDLGRFVVLSRLISFDSDMAIIELTIHTKK